MNAWGVLHLNQMLMIDFMSVVCADQQALKWGAAALLLFVSIAGVQTESSGAG